LPTDATRRQDAHDTLLWWCSEVGGGHTHAFLDACRHLALDPWHASWALSQLGHVEFDWRAGRFATAPTVLTTIPGVGGRLLICGARPAGLLQDLQDATEQHGLDVDVSEAPCHQYGEGPATILIDADPADAATFAAAAVIMFVPSAHSRLAGLLFDVDADTVGEAEEPDERFPHAPIDHDTFQVLWDSDRDDGRDGLWRYRTFDDPRATYLRGDGISLRLCAAEFGPYLVQRHDDSEPAARYVQANRLLIVDGMAPLPKLHARAAALCSGRVPLRQHFAPGVFEDHYVNVDSDTAGRILASLGLGDQHS